jgi:molybdenum cofactor biosynthesis enzyme MoaA
MDMLHLDYLEFYISHTCNFNCTGCNRFNNYLFLGHQRWKEQEQTHKKWAKKLKLDEWIIIGGEPTLNPDIIKWMYGLHELWPESEGSIITNASFKKRFNK